MKQIKHLGVYGLIVRNDKIVLIKKVGGPYGGKLDLPGGTIEWGETPEQTLIRELKEEVGVDVTKYELFDVDSVLLEWIHKGEVEFCQHIGIFYKILDYSNDLLENIEISCSNDDSKGAEYFDINSLNGCDLSSIAILELKKMGYKFNK